MEHFDHQRVIVVSGNDWLAATVGCGGGTREIRVARPSVSEARSVSVCRERRIAHYADVVGSLLAEDNESVETSFDRLHGRRLFQDHKSRLPQLLNEPFCRDLRHVLIRGVRSLAPVIAQSEGQRLYNLLRRGGSEGFSFRGVPAVAEFGPSAGDM